MNSQCAFPAALERGDLDLAVYTDAEAPAAPDLLLEDRTVWVASHRLECDRSTPLPLALFDRACYWRDMAIDALVAAGQPYRVLFTSESVAGIKAAIASGLAVGVLAERTLDPGMQVLKEAQGFPALPTSQLRLLRGARSSPAIEAMADSIEKGFSFFA